MDGQGPTFILQEKAGAAGQQLSPALFQVIQERPDLVKIEPVDDLPGDGLQLHPICSGDLQTGNGKQRLKS